MNVKKAKALRKQAYGENSKRNEYKYKLDFDKDLFGAPIQCLRCVGLRADYLKLKKETK
jgi:hypothetical protein